jgi:hypothetical protein
MKKSYSGKILQLEDARIIYRNFSGAASKYNRAGDRNFAVIIPNRELADELIAEGWNVKIKDPKEEYEEPFMFLNVKVKYNDQGRGPGAYLKSGNSVTRLDMESISCLDEIDIQSVDLDIRPFDYDVNGATGRAAYLQAINVIQNIDRFGDMYTQEGIL